MTTKSAPYIKEDIKQLIMKMHDMASSAEDCILSLQTAFIYNKSGPLEECVGIVRRFKEDESNLTEKITGAARENPELRPYVSIPGHLMLIGEKMGHLVDLIRKKINENLLFSDKAVNETVYLLQRLNEILWTTASLILARNVFLSTYVRESLSNLEKRAHNYATLHEERLIEGICQPVSSSLYINMLDAIKSIAWHTKEIAVNLGQHD